MRDRAIVSKFVVLFYLINSCLCANNSCLLITLWDAFGDGWNNAYFYAEDSNNNLIILAPNCTTNFVEHRICGRSGMLSMMVVSDSEELVENNWEVLLIKLNIVLILSQTIF